MTALKLGLKMSQVAVQKWAAKLRYEIRLKAIDAELRRLEKKQIKK